MMCHILQYVALNKSYLFLLCQNIDSELMNNTWFTISFLNLHSLLLSCSTRADLVQILVGNYPKELEPVCCQLLRGQCRGLSTLQDLEVCGEFTVKT